MDPLTVVAKLQKILQQNLQKQISPKLAAEYNMGGMVEDKRSPFRGGGIAYAGGGKAMKRGKI